MCVYVNRIITYLIQAAVCYLGYCVLDATDTLKYIKYDFIPYITAETFMLIAIFVFIISFKWSIKETQLNSVYSIFKRKSNVILGFYVALEIVTYSKVASNSLLWAAFLFVYLLYWLFFHSLFNKTFTYLFSDNMTMASHFTERPVVGTNNLTSTQDKALKCLIKIIDGRDSSNSINIALIGEWGSGKTSITNTLVKVLQERDKTQIETKKYFVLMINTQVIGNTESIVEYIRKYFAELFRNYGITFFNGDNNVAFLTILVDMLENAKPISAVKELLDTGNGRFIDVEQERFLFSKNVRALLERSGKKNVLLVIDNIDRIEGEEQLLLILSEFASVNGIISLLSLDPQKDSALKGNSTDNSGTNPEELGYYNKLDKYIHARIRLQEIEGIEYNNNITKHIIEEAKVISVNNNCFVQVNGEYRYSLFVKNESLKVVGDNNLLTKLFFINLEKSEFTFGVYLENLVKDYFCKSEELSQIITNAGTEFGMKQELQNNRIKKRWDNDLFNQKPEWSSKLISNIRQLADSINDLLNCISDIEKDEMCEKTKYTKKLLVSVFSGEEIESGVGFGKEKYEKYSDSIALVFKEDEAKNLSLDISDNYYDRIKNALKDKKEAISVLLLESVYLFDFIKYMRRCMSNYRCFKIQLRECEILDLDYLDYIVKQWKPSDDAKSTIASSEYMKNLNVNDALPLESIINRMMFEKYIHNYGQNYELKSGSQLEARLHNDNNERWIDIKLKEGTDEKKHRLNIDGIIMTE